MLTLYKRGRIWWIRGQVAGRRFHKSAGTADRPLADEIRAAVEKREWRRDLYGPESVLTFAQAASLYLDAGKSPRFLAPLVKHFGENPVRDVNAGAVRAAAIALYPKAGPATRNRQGIAPAQAIINHAAGLELCQVLRVKRFRVQKAIRGAGTVEWIEVFAANAPPRLAALAWFLFLTGARIGSAVDLRWGDVDFGNASAILRRPKGQDDTRVHLPPFLVSEIAGLEGGREPWRRVFGWSARWSVYGPWKAVCAKAGLVYLPPHQAGRHGFATGLLRANVDPVTVARLGHWKSPRHVFDTYGHASEDRTLTERLLKRNGE